MIEYTLTLDYRLEPGWMAPYVAALQAGKAASTYCSSCNLIRFPPVRSCSCGQSSDNWRILSGKARLVHVCHGLDGDFALVQFEGADTQSVVRLEGFDLSQSDQSDGQHFPTGELQPSSSEASTLVLVPDASMSTVA